MAIHFAGGTDKVAYGGSGYLGHVLGCISFWMRTTQATANAVPISIWNSSSRNGFGFLLNNTANKLTVQCYNTTGTPSVNMTGTATMNGGGWKHVALNWNQNNGGTNTCYVDGVSDSTANASPAWAFDNTLGVPPTFGRNPDAFWASYVGDIAEYGLWFDRNLDAAEIVSLAKGFPPSCVARDKLNHYVPFVASVNMLQSSFVTGPTGTSFTDHPRVFGT